MWLDHQKAANGGQPADTPQSSVVASTPVQGAAAAAAAATGLVMAGSAAASGTAVDRSISATLSPDEAQQTGTPPADSTPGSQALMAHEANGMVAGDREPGVVRSAVRALEFGGDPAMPQPAQAAGSSPLSGSPESVAALAAAGAEETAGAAALADAGRTPSLEVGMASGPTGGAAASVMVEPARSLPPEARLTEASSAAEDLRANGFPAEDGFASIPDSTAELRALLTMHRAEMRAGSEQLRAQFEAGQARSQVAL